MRCLFLGPDGRLYAGGQMGLFTCERPDSEPEELHFERFEATRDIDIQHILFTRRGELYASSYGAGLLHFEGTSTDSGYSALTTDDGCCRTMSSPPSKMPPETSGSRRWAA